ncbi:MAG: hypothetical protein ACK41E_07565 [Deinococcales bacterium]
MFFYFLSVLAFAAILVIWTPGIVLLVELIGVGLTLIAVKITNLSAPLIGQIVCFTLTDNRVLAAAQQARLEAIALAANVATLSGSLSLSGQFEAKLHGVLEVATAAVGRAESVGATLRLSSQSGQGTQIVAQLPAS